MKKFNFRLIHCIVTILVFVTPILSYSDTIQPESNETSSSATGDADEGYKINLGLDFVRSSISVMSDGPKSLGLLGQKHYSLSPSAGVETSDKYFDGSDHWGYYYFLGYRSGSIDSQVDQSFALSSFPAINVSQLQAGGAIFASFGSKHIKNVSTETQYKVGFGAGPGYTSYMGRSPGST